MTGPRFGRDAGDLEHIARRGITPAEAESAFNDPGTLFAGLRVERGEWRSRVIGRAFSGRIMVVVSTPRGDRVRIVTAYAYKAPRQYQRQYEGT